MKIKKIFAGMAASAIALSMMAITASADLSGNAGVEFQTNGTWNFRDWYGTGSGDADFPGSKVGIQGGGGEGSADISDTAISGSGDYTVSISAKGTVTNKGTGTDADKWWQWSEDNANITREGFPWSMAGNYTATLKDGVEAADATKDDITGYEIDVTTDKFNMLGVTTDIAGEYEEDDDEVVHFYLDSDHKQEVKVSNLKVDIAGTSYTCNDDEIKFKDDLDYLGISVINTYGESSIDAGAAVPEDGTVSISFHLELVEAESGEESKAEGGSGSGGSGNGGSSGGGSSTTTSTADTSSTAADTSSAAADSSSAATDSAEAGTTDTANASDSSSKAADSSSSSSTAAASASSSTASSSTAAASTTKTTTTTTTGGSTTASSSTAAAAAAEEDKSSDATENAPAGVPAGLALGFIALAGAVAVVAKKR